MDDGSRLEFEGELATGITAKRVAMEEDRALLKEARKQPKSPELDEKICC